MVELQLSGYLKTFCYFAFLDFEEVEVSLEWNW